MRKPVILFGAFDRHNFGDLLFPHVAAALLPGRSLTFAGLAERDLRRHGGHAVAALSRLVAGRGKQAAQLIHVGGEILTCDAWQAAVMLLPPDEVQPTLAYFESHPNEKHAWASRMLGTPALAPYVVSPLKIPGLAGVRHAGVGGVDWDSADAALRAEVAADLAASDAVGVRDERTLAQLAAAGIAARLMPDPAVMTAELFGARIRRRLRSGEVAEVLRAFPHGYIAVQFSADFGDDDTLERIAAQLDRIAARDRLGVALFRAGAAPWHDDLATLDRVAARMRAGTVRRFESLDLWDICALIASSRAYCGSSLHGRIVALAFELPRINLRAAATSGATSKQAAFAATWDATGMPHEVEPVDIAAAMECALAVHDRQLHDTARRLAALYRESFDDICRGMA